MTRVEFLPLTRALLAQVAAASRDPLHGAIAGIDAAAAMCMAWPADATQPWAEAMLLDGRPVAAGGLWLAWPGRAVAWLLLAEGLSTRHAARAVFRCAAFLREVQGADRRARRVEMWVREQASWRHGFARELGMQAEGIARAWGCDGADTVLYARVVDRDRAA